MNHDKLYLLVRRDLGTEIKETIWSFCGRRLNKEVSTSQRSIIIDTFIASSINDFHLAIKETFPKGVSLNRLKLHDVAERILKELE